MQSLRSLYKEFPRIIGWSEVRVRLEKRLRKGNLLAFHAAIYVKTRSIIPHPFHRDRNLACTLRLDGLSTIRSLLCRHQPTLKGRVDE